MNGERPGTRQPISRDVWLAGVLAMALLVGGAGWFLAARPRRIPPARPIPVVPADVQLRLGKVRLQGVADGQVAWEVEADHFDYAKNRPLLRITGIRKAAILRHGKQEVTLTADALERNTATGEITVSGNIVLAGPGLGVRVPFASWNPFMETLRFPGDFAAQLGDYHLACFGAMIFDIKAGTLAGDGGVEVTTRGGVLRAQRVVVDVAAQRLTLDGVGADLEVAEMQAWAAGRDVPKVPEIPASIKARYEEYKRRRGAPGTGG